MRTVWRVGLGLLVAAVSLTALGQANAGPSQSAGAVSHSIPFSMSQTTTRVQTLANGMTITHVELIRTMRDSQGRTRTEREGSWGNDTVAREGEVTYLQRRDKTVQVQVWDPAQNTTMSWQQGTPSSLVTVNHVLQPRPSVASKPLPTVPKEGPRAEARVEDLGVKSIQGVYAKGTRTAVSYPAGFDGNSGGYSTLQETWVSSELRIVVEESNEGPEEKRTTTLTSFKDGEPDPALFKAPEGYTVWDPQQPRDSVATSK